MHTLRGALDKRAFDMHPAKGENHYVSIGAADQVTANEIGRLLFCARRKLQMSNSPRNQASPNIGTSNVDKIKSNQDA